MIQAKWLIEDDAFPEDHQSLTKCLSDRGIEFAIIPSKSYFEIEDTFLSVFDPSDCVVFYGSLQMAKRIRKKAQWIPGVYYNINAYDCASYYAALGEYLLNGNYIMLPWAELKRQKEFLFEHVGDSRAVFLRPNRGDKIFTGQVVYKETWEKTIERLNISNFAGEELVIVSSPRNLKYEWRIVVANGEAIAGSQYRKNWTAASQEEYPKRVDHFAEEIAKIYHPDPIFVVDVCETMADELRLMEVGCFSCAGLYNCDRGKIVDAVAKVAVKEWQSYQE